MTDEFKQTLFNYLIGKLPNEQGTTEEIFKEINDIPRTSWENNETLPSLWNKFKYEGLIQVQDSDLLVLYGGYKTSDNQVRGIVTVLNNDFTPVKTFFQFDSGTYLRYIQCMYQDSDGTFVAIDCPDYPNDENWSFTTSQKRFIMFNNFAQQINNDYILTLQRSYIMPYMNIYCRKIFKDPNSSHYVMICSALRDQSSPDFDQTRVVDLKINVGSENEWSYVDSGANWILGDSYVEFDENSNSFVELLLTNSLNSNYDVTIWKKDYEDTSYTFQTIHTFDYKPYIDSVYYNNQSIFLNKNELYFVQNNQRWGNTEVIRPKYIGLYYYNIESAEFKTIYNHYLGEYDYCNLEAIYIAENNNDLYVEFNNNITPTDNGTASDYYFQRLDNQRWNPIKISEQHFFMYYQRALYVNNNYNLLNIILYAINPRLATWQVYNIKENYNSSKYNGEPYINTNALISDNAEIYSNNSLVFARNLYNKSLNNNTTVSTVEVPNNYLNDIDITSKNLLSETNLTLIEDTNITQKNIYETLFINFINTLLIADRNNTTQVLNQQASTYLNSQINSNDGYFKAQIYPKVVITYQDNSTKEIAFEYQNIEDTSADIVFALYVDQPMQSAEIISNDKSTVYQTINLTSLEQDKYYVIRQKMEVL